MKTTLSWLKTHLDTDASAAEIADRLVMLGHDVEGVEDRGAALAGFVVARVVSAEPHPNADRLRVCVVDGGAGEVQVVCGAPNARAGMKGVFGPAGVRIPKTGAVLNESTIRGVASRGMLMSVSRTGARRGSCRHHRTARGCAGRDELCEPAGARRSRSST